MLPLIYELAWKPELVGGLNDLVDSIANFVFFFEFLDKFSVDAYGSLGLSVQQSSVEKGTLQTSENTDACLQDLLFIQLQNGEGNTVQYLFALNEKDVPDPQRKLDGYLLAEDGQEPARGKHARVHLLLQEVLVQCRHVLLYQAVQHVVGCLQTQEVLAVHAVEVLDLVLLTVQELQQDVEGIVAIHVGEQNRCHTPKSLHVAEFWFLDAQALQNYKQVVLALVVLLLKVDVVREGARHILVDLVDHLV